MLRKGLGLAVVILALLVLAGSVFADDRSYVWTYEYTTLPKGMSEMEYYETAKIHDTNDIGIKTFQHWLELEHGLTDRLDLGIYQMWKTNDKRDEVDSKYGGTKLRFRYRFGEKGKYFVNPLLYAEFIRSAVRHDPGAIELKLILTKDFGNLNISYNQILEQVLSSYGKTESQYAVGASYWLGYKFKIAVESKGSFLADKYYWGPTISYRASKYWVAAGLVLAMHKRADDLQVRVIAGTPF